MRIAHWSIWAPNRSGMYETTRDLVVAQREIGVECGFIDAMDPSVKTAGTFSSDSNTFADSADIYGMHLAIPEPYASDGTPVIVFLHGHPLYSMQVELYGLESGNDKPWQVVLHYIRRADPVWFVNFWEDDQGDYWRAIDGVRDKPRMRFVPRGIVFGDRYTCAGPKKSFEGNPVILIADQFRLFKDALPSLYGAYHYWLRNPEARVYLYAAPPAGSKERATLESWLVNSPLHRMIGGIFEIVPDIEEAYRAADMLVSTVTCESRVVLEAHACGCPTVAPWDSAIVQPKRYWRPREVADAIEECWGSFPSRDPLAREALSTQVKEAYNIRQTAEALRDLYTEIIEG